MTRDTIYELVQLVDSPKTHTVKGRTLATIDLQTSTGKQRYGNGPWKPHDSIQYILTTFGLYSQDTQSFPSLEAAKSWHHRNWGPFRGFCRWKKLTTQPTVENKI